MTENIPDKAFTLDLLDSTTILKSSDLKKVMEKDRKIIYEQNKNIDRDRNFKKGTKRNSGAEK